MEALLTDPDPQRAQHAMKVMLETAKLDIATLRAAVDASGRSETPMLWSAAATMPHGQHRSGSG